MIILVINEKRNKIGEGIMKRFYRDKIICLLLVVFSVAIAGCKKDSETVAQNLVINKQDAEVVNTEAPKKEDTEQPKYEKPQAQDQGLKQDEKKPLKEISGLVKIEDIDSSIVVDLRYAGENNFTGKKIYPVNVCVLRRETALKLAKANEEFKKRGFRIKIWDAYRPPYVQQIFWDLVRDSRFVANPKKGGSKHNIGTAVDITLVDSNGVELPMPTEFDDFSTNAYRDNPKVSKEERKNVDLLTDVMKKSGFIPISTEWWHFNDSDSSKYKMVDIKLEKFIN
jgi:zinc D-Ala-D-Ala dipeptidase